jgi:DNA-binding transcriptional ArsR family regulator
MDGYDNDQLEIVQNHSSCQLRMSDEMLNRVASRFRTLGEPYRLRILQVLMRGAMTVGEVVQALDGNQPNVSRHLQILYGAGIVRRRREGSSVVYSLKSASVSSLCELVYQNETGRADIQSE